MSSVCVYYRDNFWLHSKCSVDTTIILFGFLNTIHVLAEVKQKLYTHSMGAWTRYVDQLEPMTAELRKHLPKLKKAGALPYQDKMNWALDPGFVYHP